MGYTPLATAKNRKAHRLVVCLEGIKFFDIAQVEIIHCFHSLLYSSVSFYSDARSLSKLHDCVTSFVYLISRLFGKSSSTTLLFFLNKLRFFPNVTDNFPSRATGTGDDGVPSIKRN